MNKKYTRMVSKFSYMHSIANFTVVPSQAMHTGATIGNLAGIGTATARANQRHKNKMAEIDAIEDPEERDYELRKYEAGTPVRIAGNIGRGVVHAYGLGLGGALLGGAIQPPTRI